MNLQQLEYITAVAESENFIEAAERCHVTQSTLSTMISRFEGEIGIRIFDRSTKPVSLTSEGKLLLDKIKEVSNNVDDLKESIRNIKGEIGGKLNIGVIPTVAPFLLPQFLNDFTSNHPALEVSVSEMTTASITNQLLKRELDIGIVAIGLGNENILEIPLYDESFVVFDYYSKDPPETIDPDAINYERMFLLEEGHCLRTQVERICNLEERTMQARRNFEFRAGSIDSLLRFVKRNRGVTLLPYLSTIDLNIEDKARVSRFSRPIPGRSIGLVVHKHFVKRKILGLLEQCIIDHMKPLLRNDQKISNSIAPV